MRDHVTQSEPIDNVCRPSTPMLVEIDDADLLHGTLGQEHRCSHHQPIEAAIATGEVIPGMVEAGARRNGAGLVGQG